MKTKFFHLLAFVAFLQLASFTKAQAQEFPNPDLNGYQPQEVNTYDEKPLILESDLKYPKVVRDTTSATTRSTSTTTKAATKAAATPANQKSSGGDPVNFNFLYYIIQKFKTSDLIDQ